MAHTLSDLIQSLGEILVGYLDYVIKNKDASPFKASTLLKQPNYQAQLMELIARLPDKNINRKVLLTFLLDEIVYLRELEGRSEPLNEAEERLFRQKLIQLITDLCAVCHADKKNDIPVKVIRLEQDAPSNELKIFGCTKKGYLTNGYLTTYCTSGSLIENFVQKKFGLNYPIVTSEVENLVDMIFIDLDKTIKANAFLRLKEHVHQLQSELLQARKDLDNISAKNSELERKIDALKPKSTDAVPNTLSSVAHITRSNLFANLPIYRKPTGDLKTLAQDLDEDGDSFGLLGQHM